MELAREAGVSHTMIKRWIQEGLPVRVHKGGQYRYRLSQAMEWIRARREVVTSGGVALARPSESLSAAELRHQLMVEELETARIERRKLEETLVDVEEAQRAWREAAAATGRALQRVGAAVAQRLLSELRLGGEAQGVIVSVVGDELRRAVGHLDDGGWGVEGGAGGHP